MELDGRPLALPSVIDGVLRPISSPPKMVIIAAQWPGWLVALIALGIPIQEAYFPAVYHSFFKPKNVNYTWKTPLDLLCAPRDDEAIYLVLGAVQFVRKLLPWFAGGSAQRLIVSLEVHFRGTLRTMLTSAKAEGSKLLQAMNLRVVFFADRDCGGATDAVHRFGFGRDVDSPTLPSPEVGLPLCVKHFLDGGTDLLADRTGSLVPRASVTTLEDSRRSVLWNGAILRPEGLLPCNNPNAMTYCPVYYSPKSWVVRALTHSELLRIYQLPRSMDPLFADYLDLSSGTVGRALAQNQTSGRGVLLPFENSPSSAILTSIIRQLWGDEGGEKALQPLAEAGVSMDLAESHN